MAEMLVDVKSHFLSNQPEKIYVKQENKDVDIGMYSLRLQMSIRPQDGSRPHGSESLNSCQSPFQVFF